MIDDLSEAELALWEAFPAARPVDLAGSCVRAEVIASLLLGVRERLPGQTPGVRVSGARITGRLDLSYAEVLCPLILTGCDFEEAFVVSGARVGLVNLAGSLLPGFEAREAVFGGALRLEGCRLEGAVRLSGAQVSGTADLSGAVIGGDPGVRADSLIVERDLLCANAVIEGEVLLWNARVGGTLIFDGAQVGRPGGAGLTADGIVVDGGLFCGRGFRSYGELRLQDARLGRRCAFSGAWLSNPGGVALNAERLVVQGELLLNGGFSAEGEVLLRGARVSGSLSLAEAVLSNPGGRALNAPLMELGSGLRATPRFVATGEIFLDSTQVRGSVNFDGAMLSNAGATVLSLRRLEVSGRFSAGKGFRADGELRFVDAKIAASAEFHGAVLTNPGGRVLTMSGVSVGGSVDCCEGFTAEGTLSMTGSRIGTVLCFEETTVDGDLQLRGVQAASVKTGPKTTFRGAVDLRHARIGVLDDVAGRWPGELLMDGLTYDSLEAALPVRERLVWLAKERQGYLPQPYEQLAAVYRKHGHDVAAREVLLAKQRRQRAEQRLASRVWGFVQDWTVGYGYRPFRAAGWLAALLLVGTVVFAVQRPVVFKPGESPPFNAFLYALDLLLPIVGFGQEGAFAPQGWQQWFAAALIAAGWVLATAILAGVTRAISRQ